ncbi:AAA family ATPase [Streptomyces sp. NPDC045431]|uniref:HelD family protein n=1 Tax=Streptomyces sp. NPDC045431 TaxID=3155613 RepID=UPI0033DF55B1
MTTLDAELGKERAHHDTCRAALVRMAEGAEHHVVTGEDVSASGADAEALGYQLRSHTKRLREERPGPLFFGRLDHADGQCHHIGRRRIAEHPASPPLVIDWRAPVARAFYQASARDPQGVRVRRRFGWAPYSDGDSADLTALEDEYLTAGGEGAAGATPGGETFAGETPDGETPDGEALAGAILAGEIERPRVGPMRDIAATIQPEQDDLVRADPALSLCVQGAPGTGKTAVGLHRAAYLLYTHPRRIHRGGLLVLGPNRTFLTYISEVLPALGEGDVRQSTVEGEIARGHEVRAYDTPEAEAVKHDARMAGVLRRALYARVGAPAEPLVVPDGSYRWRVPLDELERLVAGVRAEEPPYAVGRERLRSRVVRAIQEQAERRAGPRGGAWVRKVERARAVTALVDACWPKVTPEEVLAGLLADPRDEALSVAERAAIRWPRAPRSYRSARWTAADLVLLDELAGLVERPEGYGHIVVDEAQDLSPMQCRAIARRAGFGSLTVLGDLAQGTTPWAARRWPEQLAHLGRPNAEVVPLTAGYRVPEAVVELANRLLGALDVDVPRPRAMRPGGEVAVRRVERGSLAAAVVEAVRAALGREGSVGVIATGPTVELLRGALASAGVAGAADAGAVDAGVVDAEAADAGAEVPRVTVLAAALVKGLEFDHAVVAEPAEIVAAEPRGAHRLYVALTRAVSRLDVLYCGELPAALRS